MRDKREVKITVNTETKRFFHSLKSNDFDSFLFNGDFFVY